MLYEGIVGPPLRRGAEEVAAVGVRRERLAVPLLDRVGWVGEHHIEGAQLSRLEEGWVPQRVVVCNFEVLDAVQE